MGKDKETSVNNRRIVWIDMLKGLAITIVVVGHNTDDTIRNFIFCFHMPLFFLLAGYLFSPKSPLTYLKKSWSRLIIPYIFFLFVIALPDVARMAVHNDWSGCCKLVGRLIYGGQILKGAYGVFWFVTVLWVAQNIFNLILNNQIGIWMLPLLIIMGYLFSLIAVPLPWNISGVPMALVYIWIGYIFKRYDNYLINVMGGG